ncbi:MAG: hypothetical protein JWN23_1806 [Rhodocyclales bacterium]|nr:hypothetical protein [Rhodocyclales bacterium]
MNTMTKTYKALTAICLASAVLTLAACGHKTDTGTDTSASPGTSMGSPSSSTGTAMAPPPSNSAPSGMSSSSDMSGASTPASSPTSLIERAPAKKLQDTGLA